jgi:phosphate-selective porin OprO and OprP
LSRTFRLIGGFVLFAGATLTAAKEDASAEEAFNRAWSHATLWKDQTGSYFALSGRLQLDAYWFSADEKDVPDGAADDAEDIRWRRFRFGFLTGFNEGYTVQIEADIDLNNEPGHLYNRLTDAYIGYSFDKGGEVKLLKQSVGFTLDGATSSKKLLTLQRNALTNNLWATEEYFSGIQLSGISNDIWIYRAGFFSGDNSDEIGFDNVGYITLLSLGYDLSRSLDVETATVRLDQVYNTKGEDDELDDDENYDNNATPDFRYTTSLVTEWQQLSWGLRTDLSFGQGLGEQSDVWGIVLMPFYSFSHYQQLVIRYTFLSSSDDSGLSLGRYERELVSGKGNRYNELYMGYNLYIFGQKLKWQTGLQYTNMGDDADEGGQYSGWGLTSGLRMYW